MRWRGIRLNLATGGGNDPSVGRQRFQTAVDRMKSRGWHVQMYTNLAVISGIKDLVQTSPVPVVFDHFGGVQAALGLVTAWFRRPCRAGSFRQGLCQNFRRLSCIEESARL
jgi:predicted TIM-barrel fold metal-dependent hydrolase